MRALRGGLAAAVVLAVLALSAPGAAAQAGASVRIDAPRAGAIFVAGRATVRVVFVSRARRVRVTLRGRTITRRFRRRGRRFAGILTRRQGLRVGRNHVYVSTGSGRGVRSTSRAFTVLRRDDRLLRVSVPRVASGVVRVSARHRSSQIHVRLNGRAVRAQALPIAARRLSLRTSGHTFQLAGHHRLRHGRNRLYVRVVVGNRFDARTVIFRVRRARPIAAAGFDRILRPRQPVRLSARGVRAGRGGRLRFRWRLVRRPRGSRARLRGAGTRASRFRADVRGRYVIEQTVRERFRGAGGTLRTSAPARDRVVLHQAPNIPVTGLQLQTQATPSGGIRFGGQMLANKNARLKLAIIDNRTLEARSWNFGSTLEDFNDFVDTLERELQDPNAIGHSIVVISCGGKPDIGSKCLPSADPGTLTARSRLIQLIEQMELLTGGTYGGALAPEGCFTRNDCKFYAGEPYGPSFSLIGVPGDPARGFASDQQPERKGDDLVGRLTVWLQTPPTDPEVDYRPLSLDHHSFDTRISSGLGKDEVGMRIGGEPVTDKRPAGAAGFHYVRLNPSAGDLGGPVPALIATDSRFVQPTEMKDLLDELRVSKGEGLVLLQSYGRPQPLANDPAWGAVAKVLATFGASRFQFNSLDGTTDYAFVGARVAPGLVEDPVRGAREIVLKDGELAGSFTRTSSFQFAAAGARPALSTSADSDGVPLQLLGIANREPQPWTSGSTAAVRCASAYIAHKLKLMNGANPPVQVDDVRDFYATHLTTEEWNSLPNKLPAYPGAAEIKCDVQVSAAEYSALITALKTEMGWLATLKQLVIVMKAPWVQPDGTSPIEGVAAKIFEEIGVVPDDQATTKFFGVAEGILTAAAGVAGTIPGVGGEVALAVDLAEGVVIGMAPFFEGGSAVEDPHVTFTAKASALAAEVAGRHRLIGERTEDLGALIAGDRGRLYAFGATGESLVPSVATRTALEHSVLVATRQVAYTSLLPLLYGAYHISLNPPNADFRTFQCGGLLGNAHVFKFTPPTAAFDYPHALGSGQAAFDRRVFVLAPPTHDDLRAGLPSDPIQPQLQIPPPLVKAIVTPPDLHDSADITNGGFRPLELFDALGARAPIQVHPNAKPGKTCRGPVED